MPLTINCKHSVGSSVYFLSDNRVKRGEVKHIKTDSRQENKIHSNQTVTDIQYTIDVAHDDTYTLMEVFVFDSKEALLASL